jgi:hypothetical protein
VPGRNLVDRDFHFLLLVNLDQLLQSHLHTTICGLCMRSEVSGGSSGHEVGME